MTNKKRIIAIRYLPQDEPALENAEYYDSLFTEAHILEIYATSFANLLITTNKDYLIDPSTWYLHSSIFLDVKNKITIERLAEAYDLEVPNLEDADLEKFVERVVNFQESVVEKEQKELEMWMEEKLTRKKSKLSLPIVFPPISQ